MDIENELLLLDDTLWILGTSTGIGVYDFNFRSFFPCKAAWDREKEITAVGRIGAFEDYEGTFRNLLNDGVKLIHSPEQHLRCSDISGWYPLISDLTPKSKCFAGIPAVAQVEEDFGFPVFIKGSRQTSRHQRSLSIIESRQQFETATESYRNDPILQWQNLVVRELVSLRLVEDSDHSRIPSSFEFRTFWWRGKCVGAGRYWWEGRQYDWNEIERNDGLALAAEVARRLNVPFLVVDIAMTVDGKWIAIECNDGQESGYAGVTPIGLWQKLIEFEQCHISGES